MAELNTDKPSERPEQQLHRERITMTRKLLEELLKDLEESKPTPKRSGKPSPSPRAA